MHRDNHYEAAFEAYLRARRLPYIAVDEARRSLVADGSLKSLDFIVSPPGQTSWLVDVKGRRFPSGDEHHQYWKNWSTRDDLESLARWEALFGHRFTAVLVFAYHLVADVAPMPQQYLFAHQGAWYAFAAIRLGVYARWARTISPRWGTLSMPSDRFRSLAEPIQALLSESTGVGSVSNVP